MYNLLQKLALNTGLSIDKSKSKIYFSKSSKNKQVLPNLIGIPEGTLPTRYLEIPLSINYLKERHYSVLLDKCRMKTEGWAAHTLSFAGRIELIKTVLRGMVGYWIHSFKIHISICKEMEKLFANFHGKARFMLLVGMNYTGLS